MDPKEFGEFTTAWCPGCGNFAILKTLKAALAGLDIAPHRLLMVSGIGQAAKTPHYLRCNGYNGLHGRSLPPAQGAKLANGELTVVVHSGDGCSYGEGGNHFLAAMRRNVDITLFAHDNQIYGLTKGQASPTTMQGQVTKAQPLGAPSNPFNPGAVAIAMRVGFVARGFAGDTELLGDLMQQAIRHKGFSLLDILQPCVTFNKVNTYAWYKERVYRLGPEHDPADWSAAMHKAMEFGDRIPTGVLYREEKPDFAARYPFLAVGPLGRQPVDKAALREVMESYG